MDYVMFGNTGMEVSRLCLGTMTFGAELDRDASARVLDEAMDHGVNFLDTADSYGESEALLGELLTGRRERLYVATKVYRQFCRDKRVGRNSRTNIIHALERSLRRLKTDYVDLYQLHHPDARTPVMETMRTLDTLVRQGKIRYVGVSNHYAWQIAYMLGEAQARGLEPVVSLQAHYSLVDRQIETESVPLCRRFNLALMCYSPLSGGVLTGKYHAPDGSTPQTSKRRRGMIRRLVDDAVIARVIARMQELSRQTGWGMNQLAMGWLLAQPHATTVILGGSKPEHFSQVYEIADQRLDDSMVAELAELSAPRVYSKFLNQPTVAGSPLAAQR